MSRKLRKKTKKPRMASAGAPPGVQRLVRLRRDEAMELSNISHGAGLEAAKQHLRFLRPHLDETAVHEVAWRCEDPRGRGGIQTGTDERGDYADIAVTG